MKELIATLQLVAVFLCLGAHGLAYEDPGCCVTLCNEPPVSFSGYNLSARPVCGDRLCIDFCDHLSGRFDFLWWKASEEGIALGTFVNQSMSQFSQVQNTYFETHTLNPHFKFDPGFRFGIGYYSPCDCWDLVFNWIHYHTKGETEYDLTAQMSGTSFVSNWAMDPTLLYTFAAARWTLGLDWLDCELAYRYYVSHCCILRPSLGLRAAWISQKYHVEANGNQGPAPQVQTGIRSSCYFHGIGPRAGLDLEFRLGCGFSVVGQAAGSIVYGRYHRSSHDLTIMPGQEEAPPQKIFYDGDVGEPRSTSLTITDIALGVKWEGCVECCQTMHPLTLVIAWEHHCFYNCNQFNYQDLPVAFFDSSDPDLYDRKRGDLTLQGLTFSVIFGF